MTVISQNTFVTYTSTGTVGPYAFNFSISTSDALRVTVNGVIQLSTAYTVTPVNNNLGNGGSVILHTAAPAGQTVVLRRVTPLTQTSVYADNGPKPMVQFEASLDKLTEITQELTANQASSGSAATYVTAGPGITVTGVGTVASPFIVSLATGFAITSFTGAQAGELGQTFTNPSFAASYTSGATAANITNTDSVDSPHTLTTPFTAATLTGSFHHSTTTTTTFTLNATNGVSSPTATVVFSWNERIFAGLGGPGATSTVTASGTNAVLSTTDVIPSAGLTPEVIGQTFGPFNPASQNVYLLLTGGTHTFTDAVTGFPFAFNAPATVTFVNQFGVSLTMYLYQSTNTLSGTFQPRVAS